MTLLNLFEKVNLVIPLEQRKFFSYFNDSIDELRSLYSRFLFESEGEYTPPKTLSDDIRVLPLYAPALVDNILFLAGQGETYKGEFIRKANLAYLQYWNENAKGRRVKRARW